MLLIPTIITEPAVGYGAAAAAVFFHSSYTEKNGPPSMTGVLGGAHETEHGWLEYFMSDTGNRTGSDMPVHLLRTDANIGFYGSGNL